MTDGKINETEKATEYLANERTFLAWMRTCLSIISLGFVVSKFGVWMREFGTRLDVQGPMPHSGWSLPMGVAMMGFGGFLALLAAIHYHMTARSIEQGKVTAHRSLIFVTAAFVVVLAIGAILYMITTTDSL